MSDQPKDGGQELANEALPKPTFEEVSDDQLHSADAKSDAPFDLESFKSQVLTEARAEALKELQRAKDQRIAKLESKLGSPRQVAEAIKAGQNPDKVIEELERQSLFERLDALEQRDSSPTQPSRGKSEADEAFERALGLVSKYGLSNDPEIQGLFRGNYKNPDDFLFAVHDKVLARNTKPAPSPASASSPPGGGATATNAASAQARVDAIMSDGRKLMTPEGKAELAAARAELQQLEAQ